MSTPRNRRPAVRTGDRSYLRRRNSANILELLWFTPLTVTAVARATSLSRTAAEAVIYDLVEGGWLVDAGPAVTKDVAPGRPAAVYRLASESGVIAGLDIGAHHISSRITDLAGVELATTRQTVDELMPAEDRIEAAVATLSAALSDAKVEERDLWVVTVGSPGVIADGKVTHFGGEGMPGWVGINLKEEIESRVDAKVRVEGDSALGAVAELAVLSKPTDFVFLLSGIRTGAAVVLGGKLHRGSRGAAGLVGELPQLRWRELELEAYGGNAFADGRPGRAEIFHLAREGDAAALRAVDDFADALAEGTAAMVLAIDPETVIIGGPNAREAALFIDRFTNALRRLCPLPPLVAVSQIGGDTVLEGTVQYGIRTILDAIQSGVSDLPLFPDANAAVLRSQGQA